MINIKLRRDQYSASKIIWIILAVILLSLILSVIFSVLILLIINYCWDNPEWATLTSKHIFGLAAIIFLSSFALKGNANKD